MNRRIAAIEKENKLRHSKDNYRPRMLGKPVNNSNKFDYSGPGRFKKDIDNITFLEKMNKIRFYIILSFTNGTNVHTELDQFFGLYKGWYRTHTQYF